MSKSQTYRTYMVGAIVLVLLNAWIAAHALGKLFNAQRLLAHTLQVLSQAETVQLDMSSANSNTRAFLLTGWPDFDNRAHDSISSVAADLTSLQQLTRDSSSQQARLELLRRRISVRVESLLAASSMRRGRHGIPITPALLQPVLSDSPDGGPSVKYMLVQVENEERRLLDDRTQETRSARRNVIGTFSAAALLDLVLVVVAFQQLILLREDQDRLAERSAQIANLNAELTGLNAELETRVAQRTRELEVSNQELQAFSYSVSHDLRAPLRTIDGFSLALEEDFAAVLNDEGRDYIKRVRSGVQRMGTLIDALLQLSRVTRSEVQRETVNLSKMFTLIFEELLTNDPGREVSLVVQPDVTTEADPRLMRVAFENLLGNALKFTSKTPEARVAFGQTARNGETVYFIRDNGAGFDMQYVDRLFTAFQRLHGDRDFKGSGIGLATVSRIVRRHGGAIWAEGETGKGATFYFTLTAPQPDHIQGA